MTYKHTNRLIYRNTGILTYWLNWNSGQSWVANLVIYTEPFDHFWYLLDSSMIWITYLSHQTDMITSHQRIITETIRLVFSIERSDVLNTRYCNSERCDNIFGGRWREKRESRMLEQWKFNIIEGTKFGWLVEVI